MKNNFTVYVHIFPNNKKYFGITCKKPHRRWNNGKAYYHNQYITNAINKYGWENIKHEILYEDLSKEEAEQKEIELIAKYKSNQKEYGYNIANGGNHRGTVSEETKKKISENSPKYWLGKQIPLDIIEKTKETKKKIYPNGYHHSKEAIEKIKETRLKKGLTYATELERQQAKRDSAKKYKEKHKEEIKIYNKKYQEKHYQRKTLKGEKRELTSEHKKKLSLSHINKNTKNVDCFDKNSNFIKTYISITIASKETNTDIGGITKCCRGKQKTANDYKWAYHIGQ